ncbi:MAG: hypothetical protein OXQ29_05600 [Rhodospirillaceae bacterium]|nr:hypothetical protein [Rhodospirillaceae bacterium]
MAVAAPLGSGVGGRGASLVDVLTMRVLWVGRLGEDLRVDWDRRHGGKETWPNEDSRGGPPDTVGRGGERVVGSDRAEL